MIVHKITVEEHTTSDYYSRSPLKYNPKDWDDERGIAFGFVPQFPQMGKIEYAKFVESLPYKKGDLLVCKLISKSSYDDYDCALLRDIEEMHKWVDYSKELGPLCLVLEDLNGDIRPGRAAAKMFIKIEPEQYPPHWKEKLIVNI